MTQIREFLTDKVFGGLGSVGMAETAIASSGIFLQNHFAELPHAFGGLARGRDSR